MALEDFYILPDTKSLNLYGYIEIINLILLGLIALISIFIHMIVSFLFLPLCFLAILGDIAIIVGVVLAFLGMCNKQPAKMKYSFFFMIGGIVVAIILVIFFAAYKAFDVTKFIEILLLPFLMLILYKQGANETTNITQPIVGQTEENQKQDESNQNQTESNQNKK